MGYLEKYEKILSGQHRLFSKPGVHTVSNFRALNSMIKRSPWPMPSTRTLLHQIGGMTYVTALDQIIQESVGVLNYYFTLW